VAGARPRESVPKKIARVTIRTTVWPKRTPELKNAKGVNAARYNGLHFMVELRVVVGRPRNGSLYSGRETYM
jgi:hypothetical protein